MKLVDKSEDLTKADFTAVKLPQGRVFVVDLDLGSRSVTNDAYRVCTVIKEKMSLASSVRIFYRDSVGNIDELVLNDEGIFFDYAPVAESLLIQLLNDLKVVEH